MAAITRKTWKLGFQVQWDAAALGISKEWTHQDSRGHLQGTCHTPHHPKGEKNVVSTREAYSHDSSRLNQLLYK
jgi:hypothetical protein